ncbi:AAA family ATPase [Sphingomonas suaedae]|uniref:AAA family ATPase n=1 Tax=Sphingomonas suaedae TaxID=2599297 RepID=A0A518RF99_9SPHN|nr:AAA family ATPase [Sphingomonas suaedae]QDX26118.1 AAA family ATPase [Sphingomonas suaedae]
MNSGSRHVILSGCSGAGKSTLLNELAYRGFDTVTEPGRRIVIEELRGDGKALPWVDPAAFATRAIEVAVQDLRLSGDGSSWTFFDRSLVDAAVALQHATGHVASVTLAPFPRYHRRVFLTPPWPEIYLQDQERQHGMEEAVAEYDRLLRAYSDLGYDPLVLPKTTVSERASFVLSRLEEL